mmetsp:Transcript_50847/g.140745  ORF Transcript_50847/g.140745 Transcript_50847/m.140745 type:complete len:259 (-) Transcript_50847:372-1148(-)
MWSRRCLLIAAMSKSFRKCAPFLSERNVDDRSTPQHSSWPSGIGSASAATSMASELPTCAAGAAGSTGLAVAMVVAMLPSKLTVGSSTASVAMPPSTACSMGCANSSPLKAPRGNPCLFIQLRSVLRSICAVTDCPSRSLFQVARLALTYCKISSSTNGVNLPPCCLIVSSFCCNHSSSVVFSSLYELDRNDSRRCFLLRSSAVASGRACRARPILVTHSFATRKPSFLMACRSLGLRASDNVASDTANALSARSFCL